MIHFEEMKLDENSPIYLQIIDFIKGGLAAGTIVYGDELPSRRMLSALLGINPNTVQKAYAALEQQGIVYTIPGKGHFIRPDTESLRAQQERALLRQLSKLALDLKALGVTLEAAQDCLAAAFKEGEG